MTRRAGSRALIVGMVIASLVVGGPVTAAPTSPAAGYAVQHNASTATATWAWVVVRDGTTDSNLAPGKNSGNSSGGTNHVDHLSTGLYRITLDGLLNEGNVLVTTFGSKPKVCSVGPWGQGSVFVEVDVACFTRTGIPADASFVMNWLQAGGVGGKLAYGLNHSPTSNCTTASDAYVSIGGTIGTCPVSNGVARWMIPGLGSARGTVQVSANAHRADTNLDLSAGVCDLVTFASHANPDTLVDDEWLRIKCFQPDGSAQIYREHQAWFMQGLGLKGINRSNVAYVFANRPSASSYTPAAAYSYNSDGATNTVTRLGVGRYEVRLPRMPLGGSAQVTAYIGSSTAAARHCVVSAIETSSLPQRVRVRCFNKDGELRDTKFTLAYAR